MKQRAWFVIGMAFFWPFIKGPYLARFLDGADQSPLAMLLAIVMFAAFLCLACAWMDATLRLRTQRPSEAPAARFGSTVYLLALSYLASFIVEIPVDFLPESGATVAAALLPILSGLSFWGLSKAEAEGTASVAAARHDSGAAHAPWFLVGLVVLIYAMSGIMSGMYSSTPVQGRLLSACLAVPLVICAGVSRRAAFSSLLWGFALVPLIMSALCVIVPTPGIFSVGLNVLTAGRRGLFMLLWALLAECALACRSQERAARRCALGYAIAYLLVRTLIDVLRAAGIEYTLPPEDLQATTLVVALVIVACSLGVIALVTRSHEGTVYEGPGAMEPTGRQPLSASTSTAASAGSPAAAAPSERELRHAACLAIAQEAALTEKEELALEYVSMGYTVARIAQEHGVTENTVRTHTKGLYRKLDVHSKQEVIELVEGRMGSRG